MPGNIAYRTDRIARYYGANRRRWAEFYPSERWIFERVVETRGGVERVLDVGCAAGGLGEALDERFSSMASYTGVEINAQAADVARAAAGRLAVPVEIVAADICDCPQLGTRAFDLVTALSVADWNVDTQGILAACWERVAPGGHLVMSLRLTPDAGTSDFERSFQYIWFDAPPIPLDTEKAPYTVFNVDEALRLLGAQTPAPQRTLIYGYWGTPSRSARTPYQRLIFAVAALRKSADAHAATEPVIELHLPDDAFNRASQVPAP